MDNKIPIAVVVITKNESDNIAACLESVSWADELIVVDDESSDNTKDIAGRYTDKVYTRKMDVEGRHRNWAYSKANLTMRRLPISEITFRLNPASSPISSPLVSVINLLSLAVSGVPFSNSMPL